MRTALRAALQIVGWLILGPFVMIGFFIGLAALALRLIFVATLEGFERGYHHA